MSQNRSIKSLISQSEEEGEDSLLFCIGGLLKQYTKFRWNHIQNEFRCKSVILVEANIKSGVS